MHFTFWQTGRSKDLCEPDPACGPCLHTPVPHAVILTQWTPFTATKASRIWDPLPFIFWKYYLQYQFLKNLRSCSSLTCRWGHAASSVGSSSSGSNSAPLGFEEGGKVRNRLQAYCKNKNNLKRKLSLANGIYFMGSVNNSVLESPCN